MPNLFTDPSDIGLTRYGWTETLDNAFAEHHEAGLVPARIARVDRGLCDAVTESGPVRAAFTALYSPDPLLAPCTGDWAALRPGREPGLGLSLRTLSPSTRERVGPGSGALECSPE
ncbi:hypothetical protein OIE13_12305 [Streptosporangium sp. NBC_01810]|uniref:hypothetical protein n=1 Tax=Streptosporangium sp. NBC_01810 TaxID=2975951 RepID=UPI002DD82727|nr:hypothetical protein [Streptosporangium sp. NBC_01810]WSA28584.1 hypothetical protein OIE13_12305 [Streptosporangium sp. NBC_01810]